MSEIDRKGRRWITALLAAAALIAAILLLRLFGFRLMKVSGSVPLEQAAVAEPRPVATPGAAEKPRNIILFVADGLGFSHLGAAQATLHGLGGVGVWDWFTAAGWHYTQPAAGLLTDSAASATALSTGEATYYGGVGVDAEGNEIQTVFERAAELGYRTGIVTDSYVWDATPAAFVAHVPARDDSLAGELLRQIAESDLEVLIGELEDVGEEEGIPEWEPSVEILERRFRVFGPDPMTEAEIRRQLAVEAPVALIFEEDQVTDLESTPNLPTLAMAALERLASGDRPFLLLVESEEPDSSSHRRDLERLLNGMRAVEETLSEIFRRIDVEETLVVFTSDHETGGLALSANRTNMNLRALWATGDHTGSVVPLLARGPGSRYFAGVHTNRQVGKLIGSMVRGAEPVAPR